MRNSRSADHQLQGYSTASEHCWLPVWKLGTPPHVVQAIARHADLEITMRIYAHTNLDTMREALDKIDWNAE